MSIRKICDGPTIQPWLSRLRILQILRLYVVLYTYIVVLPRMGLLLQPSSFRTMAIWPLHCNDVFEAGARQRVGRFMGLWAWRASLC